MALVSSIAGATAAAAYLDAKYNIRDDLSKLWVLKSIESQAAHANATKRISPWYLFEKQVEQLPEQEEAIWSRTGCYTWRQTYTAACQYAQFLLYHGVKPGQYVGIYLQNCPEYPIITLALWSLGCATAQYNFNLTGDALLHCIKTSGTKLILVDDEQEVRQRIEDLRPRIEHEMGAALVILDPSTKSKVRAFPAIRPDNKFRDNVKISDATHLLYTSGTTGLPKAVAYSVQRTYTSTGDRVRKAGAYPGPNGTRWYDPMPFYHGTGGNVTHMCMLSGITLCVGKKFSATRFWEDARDSRATAMVYVGETARYLLAAPPSPRDKDHGIRMMFGNGMRPDVWERFKERFGIETVSEFFNSTEGVLALINVCRGPFLSQAVGHQGAIIRMLTKNIYAPVEIDYETNDIVRDPKTGFARRVPFEVGGEILVAVPSVEESGFAGYFKNKDATAKRFAKNVFQKGDLWYRSGDALRRDKDGRWFFLDRLGDTFRWKSENVSTAEVAEALGRFDGVVEANVYGVLVPGHDGRAGCAAVYIAPEQVASFDWKGLVKHTQKLLPRYAVPVFLRLVSQMSPMHNNKQNKGPLRNEGIDLKKISEGISPHDRMMWLPPGGSTFVEFTQKDFDRLQGGQSKL